MPRDIGLADRVLSPRTSREAGFIRAPAGLIGDIQEPSFLSFCSTGLSEARLRLTIPGRQRYLNIDAPVAQLDRAPPSEGGGRTFESCRVRHFRFVLLIGQSFPIVDLQFPVSVSQSCSANVFQSWRFPGVFDRRCEFVSCSRRSLSEP